MKKLLALFLIFYIGLIPGMPQGSKEATLEKHSENGKQKSAKELKHAGLIQKKVELLGRGSIIKVQVNEIKERGKGKLLVYHGTIEDISGEGFTLKTRDRNQWIAYGQIKSLNLDVQKYKAKGQIDPVAVRQVVIEIGIGKRAKLRLASNKQLTGTIRTIGEESFLITEFQWMDVPYREVMEIEQKRTPRWVKAVIVGGIAAGSLILILTLSKGKKH